MILMSLLLDRRCRIDFVSEVRQSNSIPADFEQNIRDGVHISYLI